MVAMKKYIFFSSRGTRGQPSQRTEWKAQKCATKCVITQPNTDQEQYNIFIVIDISLQMWQTELAMKKASEVTEMTVKNLIFILFATTWFQTASTSCTKCNHNSSNYSQVHYDISDTTYPGQFSHHISIQSVHMSNSPLPLTHEHNKLHLCLSLWSCIW